MYARCFHFAVWKLGDMGPEKVACYQMVCTKLEMDAAEIQMKCEAACQSMMQKGHPDFDGLTQDDFHVFVVEMDMPTEMSRRGFQQWNGASN